ncbi:MAG: hypothetical protein ABI282_06240, partial [Candidatus Baltobacteraceae bacterium]
SAIESNSGYAFKTVGDEFCAAFSRAPNAFAAALDAQRAIRAEDFGDIGGLAVRMALHTGDADERDGDYFGQPLNKTARLLAIGYGGQVLISKVTGELVRGDLPKDAILVDLGDHRLRDLERAERVYQLSAPGLRSDFPTLRSLNSLPNNLPLQLTSFVGRDSEVAEVTTLALNHRLVTLTGAGGVGKTRVSLQVAANLLDAKEDGAWFVELASITDPELVPSTIAKSLGTVLPSDGDPLDRLVASLKGKRTLIVLDNCEHLVSSVAFAASAILHQSSDISLLASSRENLGIDGEVTYRMPSLTMPEAAQSKELRADVALGFGAIALFADRAKAADAHFSLTDANAPVVADICRRLDGIAFAIELAAARVNVLQLDELRARLDQRFRLLTAGRRDRLPRQQTLRALIDWSYDLLEERERVLFRRLGIFVGGFTLKGAVTVAADDALLEFEIFDLLALLVEKSLVVAELSGDIARYRLLESTRVYAREKLEEAGEAADLSSRRFAYIYALFADAQELFEENPREALVVALADELEEMRAALDWSESNDPARGAELLIATRLLLNLGLHQEGIERAMRFAALVESGDAKLGARLWIWIAACEAGKFSSRRSFDAAERGVTLAHASRDPATLFDALCRFGRAAAYLREFDRARAAFDEAEEVCTLTKRQHLDLVTNRAGYFGLSGEVSEWSQACEELRLFHKSHGNERGLVSATLNQAESEYLRGDGEHAIALAREALVIAERLHELETVAHLNQNLCGYLIAAGETIGTRAAGEKVLRFYARSAPDNPHVPVTLEHIALAFAMSGDFERAARLEGYVEAALPTIEYLREYPEIATQDRLMELLRAHLGREQLDALLARGSALTPEEAIREGLE